MTAKEYLMQAYRLNELIDSDVEELEHLRDLAGRISSPNFDERVQSSKNYDPPFVKYLSDIMEMEQKIHQELCQLVVLKKQISESLEKVEDRSLLQQLLMAGDFRPPLCFQSHSTPYPCISISKFYCATVRLAHFAVDWHSHK